ncbi:MAG: 16S rRNA processing protein RimM [Firmicutes bacterium]|nr:16S rRNA processing protein RimM [Bacillota bacterium]
MDEPDFISVGEIVKAQGIQGEVKVIPHTDNLERYHQIRRVFFKDTAGWRELKIQSFRQFNGFVLMKFLGIDNMTAADSLGRGLMMIPRSERPELEDGRYYYDQIEGLRVFTVEGKYLGAIVKILETGANDVYVVKDGLREILIPALKNVIKEIDLKQARMLVEPLPGLLEE